MFAVIGVLFRYHFIHHIESVGAALLEFNWGTAIASRCLNYWLELRYHNSLWCHTHTHTHTHTRISEVQALVLALEISAGISLSMCQIYFEPWLILPSAFKQKWGKEIKVIVTVPCNPDFSSTVKYALTLSALATHSSLDGAEMGILSHTRHGNAEDRSVFQ